MFAFVHGRWRIRRSRAEPSGSTLTDSSSRRPGRARRGWIALLVSLGASLALAEVALRASVAPERFLDPSTDAYWHAAALSASTGAAHEGRSERDIEVDPELGWRMKPSFERGDVHHDARGFRRTSSRVATEAGTAKSTRILAIGDSFTYGLGVADPDTYASQLALATDSDVINAGVNGYGVDQALLLWEREGAALAPDVVVLGIYVDDVYRIGLSMREAPKPHFVRGADGGWLPKPVAPARAPNAEASRSIFASSRVVGALASGLRRVERKLGRVDETKLRQLEELDEYLLARLRDSVVAANARLLVVFIGHEYDGQPDHAWIEASVVRTCRKLGVECLNLAEERRHVGGTSWYGSNGHFGAEGHRAAATAIGRVLGLMHGIAPEQRVEHGTVSLPPEAGR